MSGFLQLGRGPPGQCIDLSMDFRDVSRLGLAKRSIFELGHGAEAQSSSKSTGWSVLGLLSPITQAKILDMSYWTPCCCPPSNSLSSGP